MTYTNVLSYLERSAASRPDACAVVDACGSLTYSELLCSTRTVGTGILKLCTPHSTVGVYLDKSIAALCSMLGSVQAGCAYSVLNPELPGPRLLQICSVLRPSLIITDAASLAKARDLFSGYQVSVIDELRCSEADDALLGRVRASSLDIDPLYINFTSGSTGVPKGIAVCHRSVIDFMECFTGLFSISSDDRIANQAPFDFDVSVKDIYSSLKESACLIIVPREYFSAPTRLMDFLCENRVTTLIWAVSALCLLTTFHALEYKVPETVSKILFSGEVMPYKALCNLRRHLPDAVFVNLYGPTEITCNCTYHILSPDRDYSQGIPIGIPFPNEDVFLLDNLNKRISVPDMTGEICVRGTALALGYYSSPEQNSLRFVPNPLNPFYPETIYRTGDLGKYNENGELVFCGRKDFQIKYMGHRIELEEIEKEMGAVPGVERCCCIFDEKRSRLKSFYTGDIDKSELRAVLSEKLPPFMIPGSIKQVAAFPLTKNGKVDRRALAEGRDLNHDLG